MHCSLLPENSFWWNRMNVIEKKRNSKMQFGRQTLLCLLQPRNSRRRLRHRVNLTYESLEARSLLATFTVTTAEDTNTDVSDGMVSLREAVIAANTNASFGGAGFSSKQFCRL